MILDEAYVFKFTMTILEILLASVLSGLGGVVAYYLKRRKRMSILQRCGIPGPQPNFWTGNMSECFSVGNVPFDSYITEKYGDICGYYLGAKPIVVVSDPKLLKIMEVEKSNVFRNRPRRVPGGISPDPKRKEMLGNLQPEKWRETRQVLTRAFTPLNLKEMFPQIEKKIEIFLRKVELHSETGTGLDFYPLFQGLALDVIGQTGFGVSCHVQENIEDILHQAVQSEFSKSPSSLIVKGYLCFPEISFFLQPLRVLLFLFKEKLGYSESSELWELGFRTFYERTAPNSEPRPDILQQLLNSKLVHNPLRVVANSVLFFEAAYETLSSSLAFVVHLLVHHPEVQEKLRNELKDVTTNESLKYNMIKKLNYMERVIKETLRLYPPQTTFVGRSGEEDFLYEKDGEKFLIPAGVHVQAGLYQLHHSPRHWTNPEEFNPDRFLDGNEGALAVSSGVWQAFGMGPRICIGKSFAWIVLKLVLGSLLLKYELLPCGQTEEKITLRYKTATMTPASGSYATVRPLI